MSVPKRFKTKTQVNFNKRTSRNFLSGSVYHLLDKNLLFIYTVHKKSIKSHKVNYNVKL